MDTLVAAVGFLLTVACLITISTTVGHLLASRGAVTAMSPAQGAHPRNTRKLWALVVLAFASTAALHLLRSLTGIAMFDASIGVAVGLYICAHPAANAVNLLFFERDTLNHLSERAVVRWLGLNLLVLLCGWMVVFVALRRLFDRG